MFITKKDLTSNKQMIKGQNNNSFNSFLFSPPSLLSFSQLFRAVPSDIPSLQVQFNFRDVHSVTHSLKEIGRAHV